MYASKTLLSLIITLCLAPISVRSVNNFKQYKTETELLPQLVVTDQNQQLSVIYVVNKTDGYDLLFQNLARSLPNTLFIKIDTCEYVGTGKFAISGDFEQPLIYLRRFGVEKDAFSSTLESILHSIIQEREGMTENTFRENNLLLTTDTNQGYFGNVVQQYDTEDNLLTKLDKPEKLDKLSAIYFVNANTKYDQVFKDIACLWPNILFVKINTYVDKDGKQFTILGDFLQPLILLKRFGIWKKQFIYNDQTSFQSIIKDHNNMTLQTYLSKNNDSPYTTLTQQRPSSSNLGGSCNRVKYVYTEAKLNDEVDKVEVAEQMSIVILVKDSGIYDTLVNEVAGNLPDIWFFIIDTTRYTTVGQQISNHTLQPFVILQKYSRQIKGFCCMDKVHLETEIKKYNNMSKDEFEKEAIDIPIQMTEPDEGVTTTAQGTPVGGDIGDNVD